MVGDEELMVRTGDEGTLGPCRPPVVYHGEMERWCLSFLLLCAADFQFAQDCCFKKKSDP